MVAIRNSEQATKYLVRVLDRIGSYKVKRIVPINFHRYSLILSNTHENLLVIFKKELYHNFKKQFWYTGIKDDDGDSINVSHLKLALRKKIKTIYRIFPNGDISYISLNDFLIKTNNTKWRNKEGKELRTIGISEYKKLNFRSRN